MKKILITNDDGYTSPGITKLASALSKKYQVTVVAPLEQKSGVSGALTFITPLHIIPKSYEKNLAEYAVTGTPVDCVKIALDKIVDEKPDLIVSGINLGRNTAVNILYSGTVAGALEGAAAGIPSLALSIDGHNADYIDSAVQASIDIIEAYFFADIHYSETPILNVNFPDKDYSEYKGDALTKIAPTIWEDKYEKRTAPYGMEYYWFAGKFEPTDENPEYDDGAVKAGYISITPLKIDMFNSKIFDEISENVKRRKW